MNPKNHLSFGALLFAALLAIATCLPATAATVTVAWDPSPDAALTTNVYSYAVWWQAPGTTNTMVDAGTGTTKAISGLTNGVTYTFWVTTVWQGVHSDPSNQVVYTIPDILPPAPLSTFQMIALQTNGTYKATLAWQATATNYAVTNYLMIARIGTAGYTNPVGTNLTGSIVVPSFSSASFYLQGQSAIAFSPLGLAVSYTRPGASKNVRIVQVSQL